MRSKWLAFIGAIALTVAAVAQAEALNFADDVCPDTGGTEFIVDTPADAAVVQNGYVKETCTIIIRTSLNPNEDNFLIRAKAIRVEGDGVTPLDIINAAAGGDIILHAVGGSISVANASVKAKDTIKLVCEFPLCRIDVDDSSVIASPTLDPFNIPGDPGSGFVGAGELFFSARGDIDLQRSDIYGGAGVHIGSDQGAVTWFCPGPGASGCIDPFLKPFAGDTLCPTFPCDVTFPDKASLKAVCFPGTPGRICGGGSKEIRVSARFDIDIRGTTLFVLDHITFESVLGSVLAGPKNGQPSIIDAQDSIGVSARNKVELVEAQWTANNIIVITGGGCVAADPGFCIDAQSSVLTAEAGNLALQANNALGDINACAATMTVLGAGLPNLNNDVTSPYDNNVRDTAAECAPLAPLAAF
jgi:hypothetical protein